jgi:hypothetical protein
MKIVNLQEVIPKDDLFYCGSLNLKNFFEQNGLVAISSYTKKSNKKDIFIYIKSDELKNLLSIWSKNRTLKGGEGNG